MSELRLKYLFFALSTSLLALMLLISSDAGITCDEVLHYDHSVKVVDYFKTHGADRSALNTPVTNLKYYGQSYDNLTTILAGLLKIDDVYRFRHIMSPVAGWLTILTTALLAVWLAGYRAGLITLLLFAASPTFIGHSQNNLKDIPFALGYIAATFAILKFLSSGRKVPVSALLLLIFGIAFSISIRAGGLLTICYMFLFFAIWHGWNWLKKGQIDFAQVRDRLLIMTAITVISWGLSILLWPFALQAPVRNVLASYRVMAHFPDTFRQIFEGRVEWSDFMPWYYIPKSIGITIPLVIFTGLAFFLIFLKKACK